MKSVNHYRRFLLAVALLLTTGSMDLLANVRLPAIFSDGMVLQQRSKVAFWGWADAGEKIVITGNWSDRSATTVADPSGKWKIEIVTPKAGGPYAVMIKGNSTVELKDVLIGEVWLCSGQSNMVFSLKSDAEGKTEIPQADLPTIRYFSVKRQYGATEFEDCVGSTWEKTTAITAGNMSAIAYYFAKRIQQELNVPVGIIYAAWGGTPAEAWTPLSVMTTDTLLHRYIDRWKNMYLAVGDDSIAYHKELDSWEKARRGLDSSKIKKPAEPATLVWYNRPWREPSVLFNGMIAPVVPYTLKGVLWYQGESNVSFANEYYQLFSSMIKSWRMRWNRSGKLPFYFVQLAAYGYSNMDAAAQLREAQYKVMQTLPNAGMAVSVDKGDMKDIHYTPKKEVGYRLASIALTKDYGRKDIPYKGPECTMAVATDGKLVLEFGPSALLVRGDQVQGFEIGYQTPGSDSLVYKQAEAKLEGNKIIVSSEQVKQPLEIRYAWLLPGEANLFDRNGLPAFPFRKKIVQKK